MMSGRPGAARRRVAAVKDTRTPSRTPSRPIILVLKPVPQWPGVQVHLGSEPFTVSVTVTVDVRDRDSDRDSEPCHVTRSRGNRCPRSRQWPRP